MLIGEAIQKIQSFYSKGAQSDDSRLTNRHIYSKLRSVRIRLLSQEVKKKQVLSQWSYQEIPCVEMEVVPSHECPCVPHDGCEILRSKHKLPAIFTDADRHLIQSVSTIDNSRQFNETTWNKMKHSAGNKFAKAVSEYFIHNGYLYLSVNKRLKLLRVSALFNDPLEAYKYADFCGHELDPCMSYLEYEFPFDGKLEEALIELTKEEVYMFSQMKEDLHGNAVDDASLMLQRIPRRNSIEENE